MDQTNKLHCLIVEDEPIAAEILIDYIKEIQFLQLEGVCKNALVALEKLKWQTIDVLFLDIHLPRLKGLDLIRILPVPPQIILTTAYQEYAVEAFEVGVVDYLVKPIEFSRFLRAANKLISPPPIVPTQKHQGTLAQREYQFFRVNKQMIKIFFDEILYVEGLKDYSKIITLNQVVVVRGQISTLEKRLSPHGFLRIHRSFLVNISQIKSYGANQIDVQLKKLPIGRSYKVEVAKVMQAITSSSNLTML